MYSLILFICIICIGFYAKSRNTWFSDNIHIFNSLSWYNLLLVILFQFWINGIDKSYLYFIYIGGMIHVIPMSLALLLRKRKYNLSKYLLAYSTFGGGNRGVLALALVSPSLLPYFFILDIGIFLSLLIIYPIAANIFVLNKYRNKFFLNIKQLSLAIVTSSLIVSGIYLHNSNVTINIVKDIFPILKISLIVTVSLYLGLNLSFSFKSAKEEVIKIFTSRLFGAFVPTIVLCYIIFPTEAMLKILPLVALLSLLPVSSLAPQFTPDGEFREWVVMQVILSSGLYIAMLIITAIVANSLA